MAATDFQVGIIGGGPAGSAMAAYLAKAGISCVVFERELFPRPHVGESLVPSSTRVFRDLDFLQQMEDNKFPHKYGAVWTAAGNARMYEHGWEGLAPQEFVSVDFAEREQEGVNKNYTYHVDRGTFDNLLLQHANKLGSEVYEGIGVKGVAFHDDHVDVAFKMGRKDCSTRVEMVVDASGRRTLVGSQLGWKVKDPVFDQYALHTWFEGYERESVSKDPTKGDYIYVHFLPITNSWVWQIPITDTVTSIGVVTQKKNFTRRRTGQEQFFWESVASRPEFAEALRRSNQVRPLKTEGDYSYAMKQICDDRLVLIGDAARFVDPIFSTGVSIALNSARFASADVVRAVEAGDFRKSAFEPYETLIRRGTRNWYDFICVYYRLNVLFTAFVQDARYRVQVLKLLQGDVYDEDSPEVLERMRSLVRVVEQSPKHVWHNLLGDLTADAFAPTF